MRAPLPLRTRVTLLYTLMGFVLSLGFALAMVVISEEYERVLVESILVSQAHDYGARLLRQPGSELPRTERVNGYQLLPDNSGNVPEAFLAQPPGIRELHDSDGNEVFLGVFDSAAGRLFFVMDLHDIEALERYLAFVLVAVVLAGTAVSGWLGWLLSGRVVLPVRALADAVDRLPNRASRTSLAHELPADELGRLGSAIDDYQARLVSAEEAEQRFLADASHELRTPISVVRGAVELLLEDSIDLPDLQPRLQRLDRGIRELSELIDALLRLARHRTDAAHPIELRSWLMTCLQDSVPIAAGRVTVELRGEAVVSAIPSADANLVVHGILRRLLPPEAGGTLTVTTSPTVIAFGFHTDQSRARPPPRPPTHSSDRRLGLTLVGRLAERMGWEIDDADAASGNVAIRIVQR